MHPHNVHNTSKLGGELEREGTVPTKNTGSVYHFIPLAQFVMQRLLLLLHAPLCQICDQAKVNKNPLSTGISSFYLIYLGHLSCFQ